MRQPFRLGARGWALSVYSSRSFLAAILEQCEKVRVCSPANCIYICIATNIGGSSPSKCVHAQTKHPFVRSRRFVSKRALSDERAGEQVQDRRAHGSCGENGTATRRIGKQQAGNVQAFTCYWAVGTITEVCLNLNFENCLPRSMYCLQ